MRAEYRGDRGLGDRRDGLKAARVAFVNPFSDAALSKQLAALNTSLAAIQSQLKTLIAQGATLLSTANLLDTQITALQTAVANETTVEQSAITLIDGIPKLIGDAVAEATAAGATPAELRVAYDAAVADRAKLDRARRGRNGQHAGRRARGELNIHFWGARPKNALIYRRA